MMNIKKQSGNAHVLVVIVLIVVILGLLGFIFWQNFIHKSTDTSKVTTQSTASVSTGKSSATPDTTTTVYTLVDAAKDISTVLKTQACGGKGYSDGLTETNFQVVADTNAFQYEGGKSIIDTSFTYAYVQYGCGMSGEIGLMKREGSWKLVGEDARIYPMCSVIKGQDFPRSIVDKCYVNDTDTEATAA